MPIRSTAASWRSLHGHSLGRMGRQNRCDLLLRSATCQPVVGRLDRFEPKNRLVQSVAACSCKLWAAPCGCNPNRQLGRVGLPRTLPEDFQPTAGDGEVEGFELMGTLAPLAPCLSRLYTFQPCWPFDTCSSRPAWQQSTRNQQLSCALGALLEGSVAVESDPACNWEPRHGCSH